MSFTKSMIAEMAKGTFTYEQRKQNSEAFDREIEELKKQKVLYQTKAAFHIENVKKWDENGEYKVLGHLYKNKREKTLLCIIRYPDETQRDLRYTSTSIMELRSKYKELRKELKGDWSEFDETGL